MLLGTNHCGMLSGVTVTLNLRLKCVTESVRHAILQFRQVSGTHCQSIGKHPQSASDLDMYQMTLFTAITVHPSLMHVAQRESCTIPFLCN